jgi:tetratricopeptide (TPR) repeat protein
MPLVSGPDPKASYTRDEVCRLLGIRESVLEDWEENGLVPRAELYAFKDLVALKTLRQLRARRMPVARIRLILDSLRARLRHIADPLQELKIFTDGRRLAVQVDGKRMEPLTGQLLLDFDQEEIRRLLEFPSKRAERTLQLEMEKRMREAEQWFERGVEMEQTGAPPEQVIAAYEKAIERDPDAPAPHVNLGTVYFHMQRWKEAEQHYRAAIAARPDYPLAWFNLGNLYDELRDSGRALECYLKALAIDPGFADAHYNAALIYQSRNDTLNAVRHWQQYLRLDPSGYWAGIARRELARLKEEALVQGTKS